MKTRKGFVSNSSTTSFICQVCGYSESYNDNGCSLSDFEMVSCINDHEICEAHLVACPELTAFQKEDGGGWGVPEEACPICRGDVLPEGSLERMLVKAAGFKNRKEAKEKLLPVWLKEREAKKEAK